MALIPLLLVLGLVFAGLLVALRYVLTRYATQATGHLQSLSQENYLQQELLKKRLAEIDRQQQIQMAKAQEEAQQMKAKMLQEAETAKREVVARGQEEAERIVTQANQARESLEREWKSSIHQMAREEAYQILFQTLPTLLSEMIHAQWIDVLLQDGLMEIDHLDTKEEIKEAQVVSAVELTPPQRKLLENRLRLAIGHAVEIKATVDPALVAGLKITLGHTVLDGTIASRLNKAAQHDEPSAESSAA